mmetsp:Transcript_12762/g.24757  ORF Transcript_12762/g.24757 Transcript_12762/m.24757 type:complete len:425 (-) Transcript_12762:170-1444(-)
MEAAALKLSQVLEDRQDHLDEVGLVLFPDEEPEVFVIDGEEQNKLGIDLARAAELYRAARKVYAKGGKDALAMSKVILLLGADFESCWNARKRGIFGDEYLSEDLLSYNESACLQEIKFTDLVLSKHFKSAPTWAHRSWVLRCMLRRCKSLEVRQSILQHELDICLRVAGAYTRCYNAWSHRAQVTSLLNNDTDAVLLHNERIKLRHWFVGHVSDHSSMSQMLCVMTALGNAEHILEEEINFASRLVARYPGHEALWRYKRGLIYHLLYKVSSEERRMAADHISEFLNGDIDADVSMIDEFANDNLDLDLAQQEAAWTSSDRYSRLNFLLRSEIMLSIACANDLTCARSVEQRRCALTFMMHVFRTVYRALHRAIPQALVSGLRKAPHNKAGPLHPNNNAIIQAWEDLINETLETVSQDLSAQS